MVHKFERSATIQNSLSLIRSDSAMKALHVLFAAAIGISGVCQPVPAQAFSVTTAAWAAARTICQAMGAGLSMPEAVRLGIADNHYLWALEMRDPAFARLMAAQVVQMCPDELLQVQPRGGMQL
jgi:hypothetical protein